MTAAAGGTFTVLDDGRAAETSRDAGLGLVAQARAAGRPVAVDEAEGAAFLGVSAAERGRALATLEAPDFTLPDLDGRPHALSAQRGRKVLLVAFASW